MPRCSVILVTYNSAESITACLPALAHEDCEIVVVDNASQDDTVARVRAFTQQHPVELLVISRNLGFAGGVNHGVRAAGGDVLLLLNPDAIAEPGAIAAMFGVPGPHRRSRSRGRVARERWATGPRIRFPPLAHPYQPAVRGVAD